MHPYKNSEVEDLNISYDEKFVGYMLELLKSGKPIDFRKYDISEQLFDYINGLLLFQKKRDEKRYQADYMEYIAEKNKIDEIKAISKYAFADSNLIRFEYNSQKKDIIFILEMLLFIMIKVMMLRKLQILCYYYMRLMN